MEYIGLDKSERIFAKRNLLHSQMEILEIIKKIREYQKVREEKLAIKLLIKKKANEAIEELKALYKQLPSINEKAKEELEEIKHEHKKREDLELEIEEIKRQIEKLQ